MLPANPAQSCPLVAPVTSNSWDDLARTYIEQAFQYGECAARHDAVVEAWLK